MASVAFSALRAETAVRERSDWPSSSDDDEDAFVELSPQQNLYRSTMAHFTTRQNGGRFGGKISASSFFCRHLQKSYTYCIRLLQMVQDNSAQNQLGPHTTRNKMQNSAHANSAQFKF